MAFVVLKAVANIVLFFLLFQMLFESFLIFFVIGWFVAVRQAHWPIIYHRCTDDLIVFGAGMMGVGGWMLEVWYWMLGVRCLLLGDIRGLIRWDATLRLRSATSLAWQKTHNLNHRLHRFTRIFFTFWLKPINYEFTIIPELKFEAIDLLKELENFLLITT